jgi:small subunit ribosomal protein S1
MNQQQQFAAWIERNQDSHRPLRRREIWKATIVAANEEGLVVDLGVKRDGFIPRRDLKALDRDYLDRLQPGDRVPVSIVDASEFRDEVIVSLKWGLQEQDWLRAKEMLQSGTRCEAKVIELNRGGLVVQFGRLRGFVPNSHLTSVPRGLSREHLQRAKSNLVGQMLSLTVIEVGHKRGRLVLSERVADREQRQQLLKELAVGEVRTGTVRNIVDFGAFVDLGGMDGLIHISELDWRYVTHPSDVVSVGERVKVYVLDIDRKRKRISLSRKRVQPDPWPAATEKLSSGQAVEGTVTRITGPGIFVHIGGGVEGLLHTSEMPEDGETWRDLVPGSRVQVRVLDIDAERRRISLGAGRGARGGFVATMHSLWRKVLDLITRRHATG